MRIAAFPRTIRRGATIEMPDIAQLVKGGSSAWIHDTFSNMKGFAWQDGYGAFTVSKSNGAGFSSVALQRGALVQTVAVG